MTNVFNTMRYIRVKYDLKGSTYGRTSKDKDGKLPNGSEVAHKDLDWIDKNKPNDCKVVITKEMRNLLEQQLKYDAQFF